MSDILDIKKKEIDERENIYKGEKINRKNEEIKKKNGLIIGLSIATAVLAASTVGLELVLVSHKIMLCNIKIIWKVSITAIFIVCLIV